MSRFTFMVCPHDTVHNPDRWYELVQYLVHHLSIEMQFNVSLDFEDFHEHLPEADMVYANPTDGLKLMVQQGFLPLVRPINLYDEAVLIANTEIVNPTIEALQGAQIATVTNLIPTKIALHMLARHSIQPAGLLNKDSWQAVISSVWNREVDFGIVYKDTFDSLSEHGKGLVNAFATSDERVAFHSIFIAPKLADRQAELQGLLLGMDTEADGQAVLTDLQIAKWLPVTSEEIGEMRYVAENYV